MTFFFRFSSFCIDRITIANSAKDEAHGERRRRMDAHEGEHVGQHHHPGPGAADRGRSGGDELDDPGHRDVMAVAVRRKPSTTWSRRTVSSRNSSAGTAFA